MKQESFDPDHFAAIVSKLMVADLGLEHAYQGDARSWKLMYSPLDGWAFKKHYQIVEFLKKYSFEKDLYSRQEIEDMSVKKFMDNQRRLDNHELRLDGPVREIVFRCRGWIDSVLLDYDLDEHLEACYFPKKASVGTSRKNATLSQRWHEGLTGSCEHIEWFSKVYMPWHGHCEAYDASHPESGPKALSELRCVNELQATLVNKTFKSLRMIVPNTALGGLYSNGLGVVLVQRLKDSGYDVKVLPDVHKKLAQVASRTGDSATVDQSLASDNITTELVELLFPFRWAKALMKGRIGTLVVNGDRIETKTMSTMGIGFTFPLQMLVFLGLTHACLSLYQESVGKVRNPRISVFGDDLICPVEIKTLLTETFSQLGLVFNEDKSFWIGPFRESCGGDYYRGLDVRPAYLPRWEGKPRKRLVEAYLYKSFNAVKRRWDVEELPSVFRFILSCITEYCRGEPFVVPPSYGDDSGLKVCVDDLGRYSARLPKRDKHGFLTFDRLTSQISLRLEERHDSYYWERLRISSNNDSSRASPNTGPMDAVVARCGVRSAAGPKKQTGSEVAFTRYINTYLTRTIASEPAVEQIKSVTADEYMRRPFDPKVKWPVPLAQADAIGFDDGAARYEVARSKSSEWV